MSRLASGLLTLVLMICVSFSAASAQGGGRDPQSLRGIYLYSEHPENSDDMAALLQALPTPGVDGLVILVGWQNLEPHHGVFNWTLLDSLLTPAIRNGKKIDIAIRAGQDIPNWLFVPASQGGPGAHRIVFQVSPLEGDANGNCNTVPIAAPWDPAFLAEWDTLLATVSQHLKDIHAYERVDAIRLTGVNRTTAEFRLPAEILKTPCITNSVETWLENGYSNSLLQGAWRHITNSFLVYFPDKLYTLPIIPSASGNNNREYPFPPIDDQGCPYQPPWPDKQSDPNWFQTSCLDTSSVPGAFPPVPDLNSALLSDTRARIPNRLVVAYQNIDLRFPAEPYVIYSAQTFGTMIGFQTNDYIGFQRAACSTPGDFQAPCVNSDAYLALLEIGIHPCRSNQSLCGDQDLQAQYIEVLAPDVLAFPDAILRAHNELHRSSASQ